MTEYEFSELLVNLINGATGILAVFFSVLAGYLIAAMTVGSKISQGQVAILNTCFLLSAPMAIWGWLGRYLAAYELQNRMAETYPDAIGGLTMIVIIMTPILMLTLFLASFWFMWEVRHPKTE